MTQHIVLFFVYMPASIDDEPEENRKLEEEEEEEGTN
jgi:hypothetical protein